MRLVGAADEVPREFVASLVCPVELHRNVVRVRDQFIVGSLKSNKNRTVVVPAFVMTALAATAAGKVRENLCGPRHTAATSVPMAANPGSPARRHAARQPMRRSHG